MAQLAHTTIENLSPPSIRNAWPRERASETRAARLWLKRSDGRSVVTFETPGSPALDELHEVLTRAGATVSHVSIRSRSGRIVQQLELVQDDGNALSEGDWNSVQAAFLGYVGDRLLLGQPRNTRRNHPQESMNRGVLTRS